MPELPEIETIRRSLEEKIIGKEIVKIEILSKKQFPDDPSLVLNSKIEKISRTGKILQIKLSNDKYLNFHLKLSGQILYGQKGANTQFAQEIPLAKSKRLPARTTRVIIHFKDGSALFFNEMRKFGWIKVTNTPLKTKGVDIMSDKFTLKYFGSQLKSSRAIKIAIMDQDKMAGIGNIYANDALFQAKVNPFLAANKLKKQKISVLYKAIKQIIVTAIEKSGSSGKDNLYILPDGTAGKYQQQFLVYQREGLPCLRCKTKIERKKQAGRSTFFCPKCQQII